MTTNSVRMSRYRTIPGGLSQDVKDVLVGYVCVALPSSHTQPKEYQLKTCYRTQLENGEVIVKEGSEKYSTFMAVSPDMAPSSVKTSRATLVTNLLNNGYEAFGSVLVDANTWEVLSEEDDDTPVRAPRELYWEMSPPELAIYDVKHNTANATIREFLSGSFRAAAYSLDFAVGQPPNWTALPEDCLMLMNNGFRLSVGKSGSNNTVDPDSVRGGGVIDSRYGPIPLMVLLSVEKQFHSQFRSADRPIITISDELGRTVVIRNTHFSDFMKQIAYMGYDEEEVRNAAETLHLVEQRFNLSDIECSSSDCFF